MTFENAHCEFDESSDLFGCEHENVFLKGKKKREPVVSCILEDELKLIVIVGSLFLWILFLRGAALATVFIRIIHKFRYVSDGQFYRLCSRLETRQVVFLSMERDEIVESGTNSAQINRKAPTNILESLPASFLEFLR